MLPVIRSLSLSQLELVGLDCVCGGWVLAHRAMHPGLLWCSCGGCVPGVYRCPLLVIMRPCVYA